MLRRRKKPPVLATIAAAAKGPPRIRRADFEAFGGLLRRLGESGAVLVTGEADAKSAAAIGLATTATAGGRRTALLECDLAEPRLAATLGLAPAPGLHEYLRREASAPQILQPAILAGPKSRGATAPLICVVAGGPTADGAALLASEDFRHATAKLRDAYDLVVFDGPPLESGGGSLAAVAAQADATLACVGDSKVPRRLPVRVTGLIAVGE